MNLPHAFPEFYSRTFAFRHDGDGLFAGNDIAIGCEVSQARNLALSVDMIDSVKLHSAPLFSACEEHRKQLPAGPGSIPPQCDTRTKVRGGNVRASE
jgi:hypothetical protein